MGNMDWHYANKLLWKIFQGLCVATLTVESILLSTTTEIKGQCKDIAPSRWSEQTLVKKAPTYSRYVVFRLKYVLCTHWTHLLFVQTSTRSLSTITFDFLPYISSCRGTQWQLFITATVIQDVSLSPNHQFTTPGHWFIHNHQYASFVQITERKYWQKINKDKRRQCGQCQRQLISAQPVLNNNTQRHQLITTVIYSQFKDKALKPYSSPPALNTNTDKMSNCKMSWQPKARISRMTAVLTATISCCMTNRSCKWPLMDSEVGILQYLSIHMLQGN